MKPSSPAAAVKAADVILVACSGGSDSAGALLRTREMAPDADIVACYVDHGVRSRASIDRDIAAVRAQAATAGARMSVAHVRWRGRSARPGEAAMRRARYRSLAQMARRAGANVVVTGHHAGDVAEWVLIAMLRGSGMDGLAVMPSVRTLAPGIALARPFLHVSKSSLALTAGRHRVPVSVDETNVDPRYGRNAVREFLREWSSRGATPEKTLARSAALLAADRTALDSFVKAEHSRARSKAERGALDARILRTMPVAVLRRVVREAVRDSCGEARDFSFAHCDAIACALRERRGGEFHAGRASVILSAGLLRVVQNPSGTRGARLRVGGRASLGVSTSRVQPGPGASLQPSTKVSLGVGATLTVRLRAAALARDPALTVRRPRPGDTCIPSGRRTLVSLARFLAKAGVPRDRRAVTPLLCVDGRIAAAI